MIFIKQLLIYMFYGYDQHKILLLSYSLLDWEKLKLIGINIVVPTFCYYYKKWPFLVQFSVKYFKCQYWNLKILYCWTIIVERQGVLRSGLVKFYNHIFITNLGTPSARFTCQPFPIKNTYNKMYKNVFSEENPFEWVKDVSMWASRT